MMSELTCVYSTLKTLTLPAGLSAGGYRLLKDIACEVRWSSQDRHVATVGLPHACEYGDGDSEEAAIQDLVVSLGEYRDSLEGLDIDWDDQTREDLTELRLMVVKA